MKRFRVLSTALAAALLLSLSAANTQAATLLYHYSFDTDATTNSGSGTAVATAGGSPTSTAGGQVNNFGDFDGGNAAGSDSVDVNIAATQIPLGDFELSLYVRSFGTVSDFDDFFSFTTTTGRHLGTEKAGGTGGGHLVFYDFTSGAAYLGDSGGSSVTSTTWHLVEYIGTTSGADAVVTVKFDGNQKAQTTFTGEAGDFLKDVRLGGRVGVDNRYIDGGIDEVKISSNSGVPEPASLALLAMGGLLMLRRRRVA